MRRPRRPAPDQTSWGAATAGPRALGGAVMGALVWAVCHTPALLVWLVRPSAFAADGREIARTVALNLALGVSVGALIGVLRPFGRHALGAALKGGLGGVIVMGSYALLAEGGRLTRAAVIAALAFDAPVGMVVGVRLWRRAHGAAT